MPGGIERSTANISNLLQSNHYSITLLILDSSAGTFYQFHPDVKLLQYDLHFGITTAGTILTRKLLLLKHIVALRKIFRTICPDIILATEYHFAITAWFASRNMSLKVLTREAHHFYGLKKNTFWTLLTKAIYPKLDRVICLNDSEKKLYDAIGCRTMVIPNYVLPQSKTTSESKNLLTIGRLNEIKGVDLIPVVAEKLLQKNKEWKWIIIGSGALPEKLKNEIQSRNLQAYIKIIRPVSENLEEFYRNTSVYVLTSRLDCFPNVLLEAMSFGVPCVAFNCPTGPAHIINHNEDGILIDEGNTDQMVEAIYTLLTDNNKRRLFGEKAYHNNIHRFSAETVYKKWQQALNSEQQV